MTSQPAGKPEASALDRLLGQRIAENWVLVAYLAIFAAAFALRFWDLGARALHHDESIHAVWAWNLAQDGSYRHSPTFHGPFLYFAQAFTFVVFTATDYTSRVSPALFGMLVVAAPLALRRWLGSTGALAAVAFLAFSPTLVYFSRFLRMDIYLAAFILAMVVAVWSYLQDGRTRWLIVLAVALTLAFSTKEAAFLFVAFLLLYLNGHLALDLASASLRPHGADTTARRLSRAALLYPVAWVIAALWPFLARLRSRLGWGDLPRTGDLLVLTGTLTLPLLTPFAKELLEAVFATAPLDFWRTDADGRTLAGVCDEATLRQGLVIGFGFAVTTVVAAIAGLGWRARTWLVAAAVAAFIYTTLMTTFWTNLGGVCSGAWGSIDYWQAQQDVRRGMQPWFYYLMVMPAYEFLPLVLALAGGAWALFRGTAFARFLVLWFLVLFTALSFAGEKMPWLNTHLAIPAALLAAWTLQRAWNYWRLPRLRPPHLLAIVFVMAAAALAFAALVFEWPSGLALRLALGLGGLLLAVAASIAVGSRLGWRVLPLLASLAVVASLGYFSIQTMLAASFERGDVPDDLLIYTQSSPEITRLADDIDALAAATGKGYDLRIAVDSRSSFAWPWEWYLRDYRNVWRANFNSGLPPGHFDVVLVNETNHSVVAQDIQTRGVLFAQPFEYPHRWWYPETYKHALSGCSRNDDGSGGRPCEPYMSETWNKIRSGLFGGSWARDAFRYWRDHEAPVPYGSIDGFAYFPSGFDRDTGRLAPSSLEPVRPGVDSAGRPMFGGFGDRPGEFSAPVDIAAGPDGSLYVVDRATWLLQKFDPDGNYLAGITLRDTELQDSGPWGLAVGPDGTVYVADTFGWRILAFDADLTNRLLAFGEAPLRDGAPPGPHFLFGPRDLAIDADGNLWVTDTGHHRIVVYAAGGEFLREIRGPFSPDTNYQGSGPGQFSEPVGIDIAPNGEIVIADMWNARVQVLDPSGAYIREFPVVGWGGFEALDKPYLAVLRDGRIAASLPSLGQVRIYSPAGALLTTIAPVDEPLLFPYGIVETPGGKLWIVEGGAARVRLFDSTEAGER